MSPRSAIQPNEQTNQGVIPMLKNKQRDRVRDQLREARLAKQANFKVTSQPKRKREGRDECEEGINAFFAR